MNIQIKQISEIDEAARQFVASMGDRRVFAFNGAMGAGKTTFIKAVCRLLGVTDTVNSPTFAIVNVYSLPGDGGELYHFDCYRLKDLQEAMNIGAEDYLYSGNLCFIEWPDSIEPLLPDNTVRVSITADPATQARSICWD